MDTTVLADQAVGLIFKLLSGVLQGPAGQAGDQLFDLVAGRLARAGKDEALHDFRSAPARPESHTALVDALRAELDASQSFRASVAHSVDTALHVSTTDSRTASTVSADRGSSAAGRDLSIDQSTTSTKNSFGGISVVAVAISALAVIALLYGGYQVVAGVVADSSMGADTTCSEFLLADSQAQVEVMKRLYVAAGKPDRAGDPFILQNATYTCGEAPNTTLGRIAGR
ncbi:MAG: hypothetical protein ABIQ18_07510 [Umezawaea sp.]